GSAQSLTETELEGFLGFLCLFLHSERAEAVVEKRNQDLEDGGGDPPYIRRHEQWFRKTNNTIVQINKIFKDGIGLGGIFHSAVQGGEEEGSLVYGDEEWSFGYCEQGTGVFSCPAAKNPMYTYRECIVIGKTTCSIFEVNQILRELSREWSWVNRFANAGDTAVEIAENTALRVRWSCPPPVVIQLQFRNCTNCSHFRSYGLVRIPRLAQISNTQAKGCLRGGGICPNPLAKGCLGLLLRQAKAEIVSASKVAYRFLAGIASTSPVAPDSSGNSNRGNPRFQATWFKNLVTSGAKPSSSTELEDQDVAVTEQQQQNEEAPFGRILGVIFDTEFLLEEALLCCVVYVF
ncbi:unnamed protein product, partial [Thlaspi arvense]